MIFRPVDSECWKCGTTPCVGIENPRLPVGLEDTRLCGPHFFQDPFMIDPELWNDNEEDKD
jgi:hypothetical protein